MSRIVEIPAKHQVSWERLVLEGTRFAIFPVVLWGPLVVGLQEYLRVGAVVEKRETGCGDLKATVAVHTYTSDNRTLGPRRSSVFNLHFQKHDLNPEVAMLRSNPREVLLFDRNGLWVPSLTTRTDEGAKVVFLDGKFEPRWKEDYTYLGLQFENGHSSWPKWTVYLWQRVTIWRLKHKKS
ncbi:MAG: hypothetical protein Q8N84_01705 [bacterium]|nr:hypothetical protein [bacterium]